MYDGHAPDIYISHWLMGTVLREQKGKNKNTTKLIVAFSQYFIFPPQLNITSE